MIGAPASNRGCPLARADARENSDPALSIFSCTRVSTRGVSERLTLTLFVARVLTDDHDPAVATNDLAFVTDFLDGGFDLHDFYLFFAVLVPHRGNPWWGRY